MLTIFGCLVVYCHREDVACYEMIKRELKIRPTYKCRCDERLKTKVEEFTLLTYTGLIEGLEHLKIETRLIVCFLFIMNR